MVYGLIKIITCVILKKSLRRKARESLHAKSYIFVRLINMIKPSRQIRLILEKIKNNGSCVAIVTIPFETKLFQRPQHLFLNFAKQKQYCIYFSHSHKATIRHYNEYLDLANMDLFYSLPDSVISKMILIVTSTSILFTDKKIRCLQKKGCKIVYDYLDEIDEKIVNNILIMQTVYKNLEIINPSLIIATAKKLEAEMLERFPANKIIRSPNAVDIKHFSGVNVKDVPTDLRPILDWKKPVVGYYGAMAGWLDWELINDIPRKRPDYQFVYIGVDYQDNLKRLNKRDNVHFLGAKDYKDLPQYSAHFDCCIIPFGDRNIAEATSPLKLFEYMAMKKTVVCTADLAECSGYEGVLLSKTKDEFIENLDTAIIIGKDIKIQEILFAQAAANTWEQRAKDLLKAIRETCVSES